MPVLPREERAEDQAGSELTSGRLRALPLAALCAVGAGALAFDLTLERRLPSSADWAEAAGAIRAQAQPRDVVQLWPPWAERGRLFVDGPPVTTEEDLAAADWPLAGRVWLLAIPRAPHGGLERAREALGRRGAAPLGAPRAYGALSLELWDLRAPPVTAAITDARATEHEVDYVARHCLRAPVGTPENPAHLEVPAVPAGAVLHLRAGVIGEAAYDPAKPPIALTVIAGGSTLAALEVPPTIPPATGWRALEVPVPPGPPVRDLSFRIASADPAGRPFCFAAWTTAR